MPASQLSHAQFGAFFYNVIREGKGEAYTLCALSGVSREAFAKFPMPSNTAIFEPTFRGRGPVRSTTFWPIRDTARMLPMTACRKAICRFEAISPCRWFRAPERSWAACSSAILEPGVFTERAERIVVALAAQAAVAMDNARLYQTSQREVAARSEAEQELQTLNQTLEQRVEERARELAASLTRLEETERRFRLLVESVTDYAIYMLDPQGYIVNWNPGAERIKGYPREEIVGRHFSLFYTAEDRAAGVPKKALEIATRTGKYEAEGWRVRKDGSRFWASVVINAIKDAEGQLLGFAKVTRDLTGKARRRRAHAAGPEDGGHRPAHGRRRP